MIAIIDYDAGNVKSVEKAIEYLGYSCVLTRDPQTLINADKLILPGVGAFGDCMERLNSYGLTDLIRKLVLEDRKPFLGICLGLQLMFESSDEAPGVEGLALLKGKIKRIPDGENIKIPHMGWNSLSFPRESRLFKGIKDDSYVYFVHSYYLEAADEACVAATCEYSTHIHAAVEQGNIFGCQFHPEKSSEVGLAIIKNYLEM